jgi:hypothetical protein
MIWSKQNLISNLKVLSYQTFQWLKSIYNRKNVSLSDPVIKDFSSRIEMLERCVGWDLSGERAQFVQNVARDNSRIIALNTKFKQLYDWSLDADDRLLHLERQKK